MKAYVLEEIGKFNIKEVDVPIPGNEEVLVQVKASGICGSDIPRIFHTGTYHYPLIPGHEFSGVVVDSKKVFDTCGKVIAEDVTANLQDENENADSWRGKRVGIFPLIPCCKCGPCMQKKYEMCRNYGYIGSRQDGGDAEYVVVPKWNLIELPDNVSFEQAAMLEPMAVAVHALRRVLTTIGVDIWDICTEEKDGDDKNSICHDYPLDRTIAVCGLGTIGLLLIMLLKDLGFERVIAIGNKDIQRTKALELGVNDEFYCDTRQNNLNNWLSDKRLSIDIFFDCVGRNEVVAQAIEFTAPSGIVMLVGNPASDMSLERSLYWKILRNQLTLLGTWNSSFTHDDRDDWHYVMNRLALGRIHPENLISHSYDFEKFIDGFHLMNEKREEYIKVMGRKSTFLLKI